MECKNLYDTMVSSTAPIGVGYHGLIYWLILRRCFGSSGGVPIVKAVTNI